MLLSLLPTTLPEDAQYDVTRTLASHWHAWRVQEVAQAPLSCIPMARQCSGDVTLGIFWYGREKVTLFAGPLIPARTENYHLQLTLSVQVSSWLHAHTFFTWIRLQVNSQWPISRVRSKWGVSRGKGRNSVHEKANSFNLSLSDSQMMGAAGKKILVFQHSSNGKYNLSKFDTNFGTAFVAFFVPKSVYHLRHPVPPLIS